MITIKETTPIKLSGLTSLQIQFSYSQVIVETLKNFQPAVFHKKSLIWELPITSLASILDTLTYLDDIELILAPPKQEQAVELLTDSEISTFRVQPFQHQLDSINFGLQQQKWMLLDGMGLGKTYQAICLAEVLYRRKEIEHCLIICGVDSLRTNWKLEIQQFSKLSCTVLGEYKTKSENFRYHSVQERASQLKNKINEFFIIVNIASIRDKHLVEAFKNSENKIDMIVVDEIHRCSNKSSNQGANLLKLEAKYKLAMTGSVITNNPESCYLPLYWVGQEHATLTNFRAQYCKYGGWHDHEVVGYKNLDLLKDEIDHCSLRRTFATISKDMPKKTVEFEVLEMSDEHRKFYESVKAGVKEELDRITLNTSNLLALTIRLRQATVAPSILTSNNIKSSKIERAVEIIEDILFSGEKVVVFSTFLAPCEELAVRLAQYKPLLATGSISDDLVQQNIAKFRNTSNYNLLIGTHGKLGTGYSLPECHYSLMLDFPWTYYAFSQSCDRIYRINSDQPVFIKALCCADTIDERVKKIVENKKELQDYLIDNQENSISQSLQDEMKQILLDL